MDVNKFTNMNWDDLRYFAHFAACGSLSGAARRLNVEHATVSRRIAALESNLQLKLVDRRGRRLMLTPAGIQIAAISAHMEEEAEKVLRYARGAALTVAGNVTISAPPAFAAAVMTRPLAALRKQHPNLNVFVSGDIHTVSLDHREADIAIRLNRPESGELTAIKLGQIAFHLFALPDYLDRTKEIDWEYISLGGVLSTSPQQRSLEGTATGSGLSVDQIEVQLAFVKAGAGIAMLPDFLVLSEPTLIKARPQAPAITREVWLIYHSDMKGAGPIRAVIDALKTMRL